jgi:hypothetical protein
MDPISTAKKNAGLRSLAMTGSLSRGFLGASRRRGECDCDCDCDGDIDQSYLMGCGTISHIRAPLWVCVTVRIGTSFLLGFGLFFDRLGIG